jgi:hypothetical protein
MTIWSRSACRRSTKDGHDVAIERRARAGGDDTIKEGHRSHEPADAGWRAVRRKSRHDDGGTADPQSHLRFFDN